MKWKNNMFDKDRFKACVDWYHANLDSFRRACTAGVQ